MARNRDVGHKLKTCQNLVQKDLMRIQADHAHDEQFLRGCQGLTALEAFGHLV